MDYKLPNPTPPEMGENPCYRCSKPTISMPVEWGGLYMRYDCQINQYCPGVVECEHFSREPGVD